MSGFCEREIESSSVRQMGLGRCDPLTHRLQILIEVANTDQTPLGMDDTLLLGHQP